MDFLTSLLHIDIELINFINQYGIWVYLLLFGIIFFETGLLIMAILPGDSLLFAVGALSARGMLNIYLIIILLILAAFFGNLVNYWIGEKFGHWLVNQKKSKFINPKHLSRTRKFYEKNGGKALVIGFYMPIIRTFVAFVAGITKMHYHKFVLYNIIGVSIWVASLSSISYWFGNLPIVQQHFSFIVVAIIFISALPIIINRFCQHQVSEDR